jgi:serine/threonine-protein phosphatase CPPED1
VSRFRFLFMADCQLGCYASFSGLSAAEAAAYADRDMVVAPVPRVQGWAWDAERLTAAVAAANRLRPAFVVMGGDMVDDPHDDGQRAAVHRIAGELDGIPIHWVPGNHDCADDSLVPTAQSLADYRRRFAPDHGVFEHDGAVFLTINTVVLDHPEQVADELDAQMAFLADTLRDARRQRARHVIVFGHHPLFTRHPDEPDTYWNLPLQRRREVSALLRAFGVRAFFCGHWHRNGGGWDDGLEVVVTGPVGYPLGTDPSGFRIVTVTDDAVEHQYVGLGATVLAGD